MKQIILLTCLTVVFSAPTSAEDLPVKGQGDIPFWVDRAGFYDSDNLNYGEFYLQFLFSDLKFKQQNDRQRAVYKIEASFYTQPDSDSTQVEQRTWEKQIVTEIDKDLQTQMVTEAFNFKIAPGTYRVHLRLTDLESSEKSTCELSLTMPVFSNTSLSLSDIQFAHQIDATDAQGSLVKNGLKIVPNTSRTISSASPTLNIYFELYGLSKTEGGTFDLAYALLDTSRYRVKNYPSTRYRKPGTTAIKTEALDLANLPPGQYVIEVTARDTDTRQMTTQQGVFVIAAATKPGLATDLASLKRYFKQIRYIATKSELETYESLNPEKKADFILSFWKKRDPTPETSANEFAAEHFGRIRYADEHFSAYPGRKGSDTHQGRIHIRYGLPTDIERSPFSATGKAFEIWTYEHLNYYECIFLDRLGDSVYQMIHSTMPGERYNPNWREEQAIGDQTDPTSLPPEAYGGGPQETGP